jgi:hypothetical protein
MNDIVFLSEVFDIVTEKLHIRRERPKRSQGAEERMDRYEDFCAL